MQDKTCKCWHWSFHGLMDNQLIYSYFNPNHNVLLNLTKLPNCECTAQIQCRWYVYCSHTNCMFSGCLVLMGRIYYFLQNEQPTAELMQRTVSHSFPSELAVAAAVSLGLLGRADSWYGGAAAGQPVCPLSLTSPIPSDNDDQLRMLSDPSSTSRRQRGRCVY